MYVLILMPGYMIVFLLASTSLKRDNMDQRSLEELTKGKLKSVQRKALPMTSIQGECGETDALFQLLFPSSLLNFFLSGYAQNS